MGKNPLEHHAPYGGQAVIEGVMMRSPRFFAVACRRPDNEIVVKRESVESYLKRFMWLNIPFLRGTLALIDSMMMGMKALTFSADVAMDETKTETTESGALGNAIEPEKAKTGSINDIAVGATLFLGLALGIGIFVVLPQFVASLFAKSAPHVGRSIWLNLGEGVLRIALFIGYIAAISLMKDVRRVFQYHGAEHKVINTFESGLSLEPENYKKYTTIHPRCGTSFITFVLILSILVFSLLGWHHSILYRILSRIILLPVIAGIGYEMIRLVGRFKDSKILIAILAPGLWLQKLTTREPTDDQVEVAYTALRAVMEMEEENKQQDV